MHTALVAKKKRRSHNSWGVWWEEWWKLEKKENISSLCLSLSMSASAEACSCGAKYRSTKLSFKLADILHSHCTTVHENAKYGPTDWQVKAPHHQRGACNSQYNTDHEAAAHYTLKQCLYDILTSVCRLLWGLLFARSYENKTAGLCVVV